MSASIPASSPGQPWVPLSIEDLAPELPSYEILGLLGRGGMGAVYLARQKSLNREVAIKVLPPIVDDGEMRFAERFQSEAQAMARLNHPGIVAVYDAGETPGGLLYFVMEFVQGTDVQQMIADQGHLPAEHAYAIAVHVCDALAYAHENGLIHRDIKPANIMVDMQGRVKVADFGLAKAINAQTGFTQSNMAVGTPDFVAPEALIAGESVDERADLYAVGVMLYQMLTGQIPRGAFKPASALVPGVDARFDDIVSKAMQVDRNDRHSSATELRQHLDSLLIPAASAPDLQSYSSAGMKKLGESSRLASRTSGATSSDSQSEVVTKTKAPLLIGVAALVALVIGAFVLFSGGKKTEESSGLLTSNGTRVAEAATSAPVTEASRPKPAEVSKAPEPKAAAEEKTTESTKSEPSQPTSEEVKKEESKATSDTEKATPAPAKVTEAPKPKADVASAETSESAKSKEEAPKPAAPAATTPAPLVAQNTTATPSESASPTPKPETPPTAPTPNPLADLPGLSTRLDGYHKALSEKLGGLAMNYHTGLEERINQAVGAGDLKLVTAFTEEKARVEALSSALASAPVDPVATAADPSYLTLPALPEGTPEALTTLRQTWTSESKKIRVPLDTALQQSLQALEIELTQAREIEKAKAVLAYRESLVSSQETEDSNSSSNVGTTPAMTSQPEPTTSTLGLNDLGHATKDTPFVNSLGMIFVPVPGTDVLFCIHETRYKDYEVYVRRTKKRIRSQIYDDYVIKSGAKDHPIAMMNWEASKEFCEWLSEKEGRTYRLPTDREWSIAVGIGSKEVWGDDTTPETVLKVKDEFPWGKEWPPPTGAGNYSDESRKAKAP